MRFWNFFLFLLILSCVKDTSEERSIDQEIITIENLLYRRNLKKTTEEIKISLLDSAYSGLKVLQSDSTHRRLSRKITGEYLKLKEFDKFIASNYRNLKIGKVQNDTLQIASAYWYFGSYYNNYKIAYDSAYYYYYNAQRLYNLIDKQINAGDMLYNMALVQMNAKDYIGSEVTIVKTIPIYKKYNKYRRLYSVYNLLGINNLRLKDHKKALFYFDKSLDYLESSEENQFKLASIRNNKGVVHKDMEAYEDALVNYKLALETDSLLQEKPRLYARLIDNIAYAKFKIGDTSEVKTMFFKSLRIRDSIAATSDITTNKLHLSEFYAFKGDSTKALKFAQEAHVLAGEIGDNKELLQSYLVLADLDKENGVEHTKKYIALNAELQNKERKIRNKFARIRYETDEFIDKNKQLSKQRYWILALLAFTLFTAILGYVIKNQRSRNKQLEFERQQQRANEEIYNLMLSQQLKYEEGTAKEKKRVSEELHDGILGRLFGTRLSLGSLNEKSDKASQKTRQLYLDELKSIEEEVRGISHGLSSQIFNSETSYMSLVHGLLETQSIAGGFLYQVDSEYEVDWEHASGNTKINLYRIIQETIQNINKHAKASNVYVNFERIGNNIRLTVRDDGVGFKLKDKKEGIGLKNIKSRVAKLNGEVFIQSAKNQGTTIAIDVPLNIIIENEETV